MAKWKFYFVLILPLTAWVDSKETVVKTISRESDFTPICTNSSTIILLVCKIKTKMSRGEECRLMYHHAEDFVNECDSRFTLLAENQTVLLHLANLTPADSGNYTCECSYVGGVDFLHLDIHVKEDEDRTKVPLSSILIGPTIVIFIAAVIIGFIYRGIHQRSQTEALSTCQNMELEDIEPYSTFTRRESGLYSTVRVNVCNTSNNSNVFTTQDTLEGKCSCSIYTVSSKCDGTCYPQDGTL
ncbi:uncharacterized protein LOC121962966 [Plectropomus leopardus]|uniref:uncharacterized protein LOC121962966 n=1 Tax=Plectropomus leopardus TaxID=160734 RepID=UPI001C4DB03A|nr:uncharacterized protein LOC121962966 [Plectropomus leopardus]